ncbi:MAG TPA: T9SS type A sorting domain-containing protein [bacterium]
MLKYLSLIIILADVCFAGATYIDGVLVYTDTDAQTAVPASPSTRQFNVVDSFPAAATDYSMGIACDGQYLWNNEAFVHWFARMDTSTGAILNTFNTSIGDRDMTFDGQYLWASDWSSASISKFDTATCTMINTYYPPFYAGKPNGMAWDGNYLWVGEESGRIYKMTTTGDTVRSIPPPVYNSYEPRGLAFDGTHLWVGYQDAGLIYEVDTTNGAVIASYTAPGTIPGWQFQQGLDCDGQFLWSTIGGDAHWIYQIDIGLLGAEEHKNSGASMPNIKLSASPNPFIDDARITLILGESKKATLKVIDASGRVVSTLIEGKHLMAGEHVYNWQPDHDQAGIFFAVLEVGTFTKSIKLIKI